MKNSTIGKRVHQIRITDAQLIRAFNKWKEEVSHEDAPTIGDLARLTRILSKEIGQSADMISDIWLRNKFVQLRKADRLEKKRDLKNKDRKPQINGFSNY